MSSDNTIIVKNTIILYARLIITSFLGLFTSRLVLQSLGASDFGLYSVVGGIVVMLNILNLSMTSSSYRYISFEMGRGEVGEVNKVFNISLVLHFALAILIILFAETLGLFYIHNYLNVSPDKIGDAIFVLHFSVLATVFSVLAIPFQGLITATEKFSVRAFIEIISSVLRLGIAVSLTLFLGNRLRFYAVLTALVFITVSLLYVSYCHYKYYNMVRWNFQKDKQKYKEMVGFSGWILLGACAGMGKTHGAALIINMFFGTVLNAAFGIANQVNTLILTFSRTLGQVAIPQITKSYSGGQFERMILLACYITKYTFFLMMIPALPILLETHFLLNLWLTEVPQYTAIFCQLMIINAVAECLTASIPAVIHATGKIKYFQIVLSTTLLTSLPIGYILFKMGYPPYAILITYVIMAFINVVIYQFMLVKLIAFDVKQFMRLAYLRILYVVILMLPLLVVRNMCPAGLTRFIFISLISVVWLLAMVYWVGMEKVEKDVIHYRVGRLWQRLFCKGNV